MSELEAHDGDDDDSPSSGDNLADLRDAFLEVRFSHKDAANLDKRIKNSRMGKIEGRPVVRVRTGMTAEELKRELEEAKGDVDLSAQNVRSVLAICGGDGEEEEEQEEVASPSKVLEEVVCGSKVFGYLGAVRKKNEEEGEGVGGARDVYDLALVAYRTDYKIKAGGGICGCCQSQARQKLKHDYLEAIVLSYLRIKAVEQLRIEGLTTRGQHHRKGRFRARSPQLQQDEEENNDQ